MDQEPAQDPSTPNQATPVPAAPEPTSAQTNQPLDSMSSPQNGQLIYPAADSVEANPAPNPEPEEEQKSWPKIILLGVVNWLLIPAAIVFILHNFVFQAFHVIGTSMVPTLHETDYLIISKIGSSESGLARAFGKDSAYIPKRQQVIVFHYPQDPSLVFIKRVIALPGEHVVVKDGTVTVYNQAHPNGFNPDAGTNRTENPTLGSVDEVVPAGSVFVLGDNRTPNGSYDSRDWGTLPYKYIIGEAVLRLLPVDKIGIL